MSGRLSPLARLTTSFFNGGLIFSTVVMLGIAAISLYAFLLLTKTYLVVPGSFGGELEHSACASGLMCRHRRRAVRSVHAIHYLDLYHRFSNRFRRR